MADHDDFVSISPHAEAAHVTPPRAVPTEFADTTPAGGLDELNDSGLLLSPDGPTSHVLHGTTPPRSPTLSSTQPPVTADVPVPRPAVPPLTKALSGHVAPKPAPLTLSPTPSAACCCCWTRVYDRVAPYVNWEDPTRTGLLFLLGLAGFFVFGVLRVGLVSFLAHLFLAVVVVTGLLHALTTHSILDKQRFDVSHLVHTDLSSVPPALASCIQSTATTVLTRACKAASWTDPTFSLQVASGVWLVSHHKCLFFGKITLFVAFVALFTVPFAYQRHQAQVSAFLKKNVYPVCTQVSAVLTKARSQVTLTNGLFGAVLGGVVWASAFPVTIWISLCATVYAVMQLSPFLNAKTD